MTNAILLASGLGKRMNPLTLEIPKPLIKVADVPMIETVIAALNNANVENIYVVVGYLASRFEYLKQKYSNVKLVYNSDYETVNNISSVYYASYVLKRGDCYICEADLYISDSEIFKINKNSSCYFGKMVSGYSGDWVFDLNNNSFISRVGKGGTDCYNMVGLSYFTAPDARLLSDAITLEYGKNGYETMFWDDVVNKNLDKLKLKIQEVHENQIIEIDTVDELEQVRNEVLNGSRKIS